MKLPIKQSLKELGAWEPLVPLGTIGGSFSYVRVLFCNVGNYSMLKPELYVLKFCCLVGE